MPLNSKQRRAAAVGAGRPFLRSHEPDATKGEAWRESVGSFISPAPSTPLDPTRAAYASVARPFMRAHVPGANSASWRKSVGHSVQVGEESVSVNVAGASFRLSASNPTVGITVTTTGSTFVLSASDPSVDATVITTGASFVLSASDPSVIGGGELVATTGAQFALSVDDPTIFFNSVVVAVSGAQFALGSSDPLASLTVPVEGSQFVLGASDPSSSLDAVLEGIQFALGVSDPTVLVPVSTVNLSEAATFVWGAPAASLRVIDLYYTPVHAYVHAIRELLREELLGDEYCDTFKDGRPRPDSGQYYVSVYPLYYKHGGSDDQVYGEDVKFGFTLGITQRVGFSPEDRFFRDALYQRNGAMWLFEHTARVIRKYRHTLCDRALNYLDPEFKGQYVEPPNLTGTTIKVRHVGPDHFRAQPSENDGWCQDYGAYVEVPYDGVRYMESFNT